ncbi:MAG: hypothetical protein ABJA82_01520 [Myxococcales bacterium]
MQIPLGDLVDERGVGNAWIAYDGRSHKIPPSAPMLIVKFQLGIEAPGGSVFP